METSADGAERNREREGERERERSNQFSLGAAKTLLFLNGKPFLYRN